MGTREWCKTIAGNEYAYKEVKGGYFATDQMPGMAFAERSWGELARRDEVKSLIEH
ncbi:hypothetical protein [Oceanimonas smirnovii]|uniref:hypothetical protein n=1 Tax=Oceanimonas smirnovii TaxID=264574 RepID=UPI003FD59A4E